ncbi:E3 ubiquitin-protein ligase bre-1 [Frankliniella fusca]|uniref:E3 ubiquitin-protein ligase bre-1 n=1 Tax=Frankliniella fusca TaxID=407009 RepID=A0AAE1H0V0_9NEOP|nr:E3 ubiquitin-protein ligase bre-1 [Frankliniella fusca]
MTHRAANGALALLLAASGLVLALAVPAPAPTTIFLQDQGIPASVSPNNHLDVIPETIPMDLTSEEIKYATQLFGSDILDNFSNSQPKPTMANDLAMITKGPLNLNAPSPGFFRWLQQRYQKKALEKQLRTFLENEEKFLEEQINEQQQQLSQIQNQWTKTYELQGRILQQQTTLQGQKEVLKQLEGMPTPYYEPSNGDARQSRWQSTTPTLITSQSLGKTVFSMTGPMRVAANQDPYPAPAPYLHQDDSVNSPAAPTILSPAATQGAVVTPGVPDSLAQFAKSQTAGAV